MVECHSNVTESVGQEDVNVRDEKRKKNASSLT